MGNTKLVIIRFLKLISNGFKLICCGVLFIFTLGFVRLSLYSADFPRSRDDKESNEMVFAVFQGFKSVRKSFFVVDGFLQGCTCYYRFQAPNENIKKFVTARGWVEISHAKIRYIEFSAGTPYWWKPQKLSTTHCYGNSAESPCVFSWDEHTGQCYLKLNGG